MRFEVRAAYVLGVLLPLAEVARRRTDFTSIAGYVDDFIIGAFLVLAARAVTKSRPNGNAWLIAAWAALCSGLYYSFLGQLDRGSGADVSGLSNALVATIKAVLFLLAAYSLVRAIRASRPDAAVRRS